MVVQGGHKIESKQIPYGFDAEGNPTGPLPAQKTFHDSKKKFRLYSGAYRAGKTKAGCQESIKLSLKYPGTIGAICRLVVWELRLTTRKTFFDQIKIYEDALETTLGDSAFGDADGIMGFKKSENTYRFKNGSTTHFLHMENFEKLGSLELGFWFMDEGSELNEDVYRMMVGRLNQAPGLGFIATNPADEYNWVYVYFYKKPQENPKLKELYEVIETTTYDNPYLPEGYVGSMEAIFDDDYKRRYLMGQWGTFEGLVYKAFNRKDFVTEFDYGPEAREGWTIKAGQDLGNRNPSVNLTMGYDGERIFIFDEFYKPDVVSDEFIEETKTRHKKYNYQEIVCDPSALDTIIRQQQAGLPVRKANNAVDDGIRVVKQYLKVKNDVPMMLIHPRCVNTIREFETYKYPKNKGTVNYDKPMKENDHALDALRYVLIDIKGTGELAWIDASDLKF